jgi:hypothetical protein
MKRDLTNREWIAYWLKVGVSNPTQCARWGDELCEHVRATRRQFIAARKSGELARDDDDGANYFRNIAILSLFWH